VPGIEYRDLSEAAGGEASALVAERVRAAREIQAVRFARTTDAGSIGPARSINARLTAPALRACASPDVTGRRILERAMSSLALSARAHDRILRVARTIADLEGSGSVRSIHVAEAIQYRCLDRAVEVVATAP